MSDLEKALALLEYVPPYKMGYVLAYLQGLTAGEGENISDDDPAAEDNKGGSDNE